MSYLPPYLAYTLVTAAALILSLFSVPRIILIAKRKKLYDQPDNGRKIHKEVIPNLGGIAIFFSTMIVSSFFVLPGESANWWHYMVTSALILFIIGLKDDILILTAAKKFMAQILAAAIVVIFADIRLKSLGGIMGVDEMPYLLSVCFSITGIIFVTNAFNLIDGIDGLAGSIGAVSTLLFGVLLAFQGNYNAACLAFALFGGIAGFLKFNHSPAKIFMGDSGSLFLGFTIAVLGILFINSFSAGHVPFNGLIHSSGSALIISLAILFIPVFDSFRVFVMRIARGKHPFEADRIHIHHYLLDLGLSHNRAVSVLMATNVLIISLAFILQDANPNVAILSILMLVAGLLGVLAVKRKAVAVKTEVKTSVFESIAEETTPVTTYIPSPKRKAEKKEAVPSMVANHG